jgi:hypothetical protein
LTPSAPTRSPPESSSSGAVTTVPQTGVRHHVLEIPPVRLPSDGIAHALVICRLSLLRRPVRTGAGLRHCVVGLYIRRELLLRAVAGAVGQQVAVAGVQRRPRQRVQHPVRTWRVQRPPQLLRRRRSRHDQAPASVQQQLLVRHPQPPVHPPVLRQPRVAHVVPARRPRLQRRVHPAGVRPAAGAASARRSERPGQPLVRDARRVLAVRRRTSMSNCQSSELTKSNASNSLVDYFVLGFFKARDKLSLTIFRK